MEADIGEWLGRLWDGAAGTILWEVAIWGALATLLCVVGILAFKLAASMAFGDAAGTWQGAWKATFIVVITTAPVAALTIGAGHGLMRGAERALRESEFGQQTLPALTSQGVSLYGIVYFADPDSVKSTSARDLLSLRKLDEVRSFARGGGALETRRLKERLDTLKGSRLDELARKSHDDMSQLTPVLGQEFPGLARASNLMMDFALTPEAGTELGEVALGPLFDVESAANLQGDPDTVTQAELAEHLRERVAIPALLAPIAALVRPWQFIAAVVIALMLLFLGAMRVIVWRTGGRTELAQPANSN